MLKYFYSILGFILALFALNPTIVSAQAGTIEGNVNTGSINFSSLDVSKMSNMDITTFSVNQLTTFRTTIDGLLKGDLSAAGTVYSKLSESSENLQNAGQLFNAQGDILNRETKYQFRETTDNPGTTSWVDNKKFDVSQIHQGTKCCFQVRARGEVTGDISDWSNERCRVGSSTQGQCNYKGIDEGVCRSGNLDSEDNCQPPAEFYEEDETSCDGLDNDCDGEINENNVCEGDFETDNPEEENESVVGRYYCQYYK